MRRFNTSRKMTDELAKHKKHCEFCGHTMTFYAFEPDKKLCDWCKKYNYRDEAAKFKDKLKKQRSDKHES